MVASLSNCFVRLLLSFRSFLALEIAQDYFRYQTEHLRVIGGIVSPVADAYGKRGLISAEHRIAMAKLACEDSNQLAVDDWEANQPQWTPTLTVLENIRFRIEEMQLKGCRIVLLVGSDVFESFKNNSVWDHEKLDRLLKEFGVVVIERGSNSFKSLFDQVEVLSRNRNNIHFVHQTVKNDVSSTAVRSLLHSGLSVRYLIPDKVLEYIQKHKLYQ